MSDAMKNAALRALLLLLAFASAPSWAGEIQLLPDFLTSVSVSTEQETSVPLARRSDLFGDFRSHLEAAIESRDLVAIQAVYQTNGVAAEELNLELSRWRQMLGEDANVRMTLYYKELSTLPPQAHKFWEEQAHHLTKHEVTHLVFVQRGTGVRLMLPLVVVGDRLLIVPSNKRKTE